MIDQAALHPWAQTVYCAQDEGSRAQKGRQRSYCWSWWWRCCWGTTRLNASARWRSQSKDPYGYFHPSRWLSHPWGWTRALLGVHVYHIGWYWPTKFGRWSTRTHQSISCGNHKQKSHSTYTRRSNGSDIGKWTRSVGHLWVAGSVSSHWKADLGSKMGDCLVRNWYSPNRRWMRIPCNETKRHGKWRHDDIIGTCDGKERLNWLKIDGDYERPTCQGKCDHAMTAFCLIVAEGRVVKYFRKLK